MTDSYIDFKRSMLLLTGIDLNLYKEAQMKRRIDTFIKRTGIDSYNEFIKRMKQNQKLLHSFVSYLTINVTEFNRNPEQWKIFENKIIPLYHKVLSSPINIWSAACSTGEEPYTIAMYMAKYFLNTQFKILATDIDDDALAFASEGIYLERSLMKLDDAMISKSFRLTEDRHYAIKRNVRSQVEFKKHNLLSNIYPKDFDIICCRNVTIYFTNEAKKDVFKRFAAALKPGGILFIGSTEQIPHAEEYGLESYDTFFYRKK